MYLSKAKVSYALIIESTRDHCPRKHPLRAEQSPSAEEAPVVSSPRWTKCYWFFRLQDRRKAGVTPALRSRRGAVPARLRSSAPAPRPPPPPAAPGAPRSLSPADGARSPPPPLLAAGAPEIQHEADPRRTGRRWGKPADFLVMTKEIFDVSNEEMSVLKPT